MKLNQIELRNAFEIFHMKERRQSHHKLTFEVSSGNLMACSTTKSDDELAVSDFLEDSEGSSKGSKDTVQRKKSSSSSDSAQRMKSSSSSKSKHGRKASKQNRKASVMVQLKKPRKRPKPPIARSPHRTPDSKVLDMFPKPVQTSSEPTSTPLNKIQKIAMGAKKDKDAYPTMDDIKSDWDDEQKEKIKPKKRELDDKQKIIAMGAKKDSSAYPTMDDIMSDWDSNEDDKKRPKKKKDLLRDQEPQKMWIGPQKKKH
ncbi:hypothetical protein GCK32_015574 [Trichostrongylus colubriformis]|uniref:Uncharacterized protein n=1 Tax=Trichostrongylus colubriformis TaxID=6319 RepID=A0AAN8EVQ0_TRICO